MSSQEQSTFEQFLIPLHPEGWRFVAIFALATLGVMPFSAESVQHRQFLTQILEGAVAHFGPIVTQTQGRILLDAELELPAPITAVGLVTGLTRFLVPLKPYLGLMAMVRMLPAQNNAG